MNVVYFLFFILITAEVPKVYSNFISEDDCESTSGFYNKPAKGFSIKEWLSWFKRFGRNHDISDCDYSSFPLNSSEWETCLSDSDI